MASALVFMHRQALILSGTSIATQLKKAMEERPLDNIEEKRDFDPAKEKRTLDNNREKGGLNDGNPNTDRTPASSVQEANSEGSAGSSDNHAASA
ncbi:MAG TPA: hypothetical protein VER36_11690 [Flavisolibacter sp.]|nr:hypothetical protein [Flavisolibacter sp.]